MAETDDAGKEQKLESARRFCDLMEEEEDISIAQSVAACRELANWLETTSDEEIILTSLDCFSLLLERLNDQFRPLLSLTVGPLLTTLGQQGSKVRLAAITLLTNLVEIHTAKEVFELSINGFSHEEFRIREGCCLFVLSVIKRLGSNSGLSELIHGDETKTMLTQPLVKIATADSAANARNAAIAAICELLKLCASHKARNIFDQTEGADDPFLQQKMDGAMGTIKAKMEAQNRARNVESQSGDWLEGVSKMSLENELFLSKLDSVHESLEDPQSDAEEKVKALRLFRSILHSNPHFIDETLWQEIAFLPPALVGILKSRKVTRTIREACLTIQHICSIRTSPNSLIDESIPHLFALLHRAGDNNTPGSEAIWNALKMCIRKFQHSKVIKHALKANPSTNPALKDITSTLVRRRIMNLVELMLTLWEDARPLRKMKSGIIEAIHRGVYDADGETRQCARRAWHGLHAHFPSEAAELLRSLTTAQQNLILGKVAESRAPSRGGSRANSPGRSATSSRQRPKIGYSQPVSRSGSPGRRRIGSANQKSASRITSARSVRASREASPTRGRVRPVNGTRTTVTSRRGSRASSPSNKGSRTTPSGDKTVPVIKALSAPGLNDKKAGLIGLKRLIEKQVPFRTPELKKILESFRGLLSGRGPLFLTALDCLSDFLAACGPVLDYPWCNFLVPALTARAADSSLPGQSLAAVFKARSIAIENLNPSLQLQALSKLIQSESDNQPRTKVQICVWLTHLAPRIEGNELQLTEVRIAITRIVQWGGELSRSNRSTTKSSQMRKCAHEGLLALQNSCPTEFETLLDSLPPTTSETARYLLSASQNGSRIASKASSRIGSRATSPHSRPGTKIPKPKAQPIRTSSRNSSRSGTPIQNRNSEKNRNHEPVSTSDLSEEMSSMRLTGSKSQNSIKSSSSSVQKPKDSAASNTSDTPNGDARPPPSPEEPETLSDVGGNPVSVFVDETKPTTERLVAIESIEPELLDETEIGRLLLGLQKCIQSEIDTTLQQTSFDIIGRYSEIVPKQFQNFTAPLLVTVAKLSINEEYEISAGECLNKLTSNLPPITLVEPLAVLCSSKHDNDELRNIGLTAALLLPKRFKNELSKTPNESGDAATDISDLSFWGKISACGIESAQSKLSTIRKLGCSLIANLAINSSNQEAIDEILDQLPETARRLASAHIRKAVQV